MGVWPKQHPRFKFVDMGEEKLLYDQETHNVIHLDASAVLLWSLCDGTRDVDAITLLLGDAFPEQRAQIAADVEKTVAALAAQGALTLASREALT